MCVYCNVKEIVPVLKAGLPSIVSVFCGADSDTGVDPIMIMKEFFDFMSSKSSVELLYESTRSIHIYQETS